MTTGSIDELMREHGAKREALRQDRRLQSGLRLITQAEVNASALTGSDAWDKFLSYLTHAAEELEGIESGLRDKLASLQIVSHDEIIGLKIELADVTGRLDMLRVVIALPKQIMEASEGLKEPPAPLAIA